MKKEKIMKNHLEIEFYTKGNQNNWYTNCYFYNGKEYERFTTKATGYGYDKQSTCVSNAINKYNNLYERYNKKAKKYTRHGLYEDNTISYGIGLNAVIDCLKCFKNVKIIEFVELNNINAGKLVIEFTTNEERGANNEN